MVMNLRKKGNGHLAGKGAGRLKTWLRSTMKQEGFSNVTIHNTHKQRQTNFAFLAMSLLFVLIIKKEILT